MKGWCIVCSNTWGLLLSTLLMGSGLVAVPKYLWKRACPKQSLEEWVNVRFMLRMSK